MAEKPTHEKINQKEMLTKASSAQWQTTFDAINDAVCLLDMNGKILRCNKTMESFLKKSSKEIIGGTCWELVHGTDKPVKGCPIVRMKKTLCRETLVLKVDDKWLNVTVDPVIDETGNLTSAVHIISDITRRKQTDETQRESEEKYRALYDNAPLSYQALDENGCFIDVNPAWQRTIGYEKEEVIGKWFGNFLHPDWKPHFEKNFPEFKRCGYVHDIQFKIRHKDGHFLDISFEGSIGYHSDGSFKQTYCVFQDITKRKQAEKALRENELRYRSLTDDVLDTSSVGIFILDSDFHVVWVNQALERYFGLRREEIIGKDKRQLIRERIKDIFEDPVSFAEKVFATYDDNTYIEHFECHIVPDSEREERWLEHWSQPILSGLYAGGRVEHYSDITERKRAEKTLRESKERLKTTLDSLQTGIVVIDAETHIIIDANPAAIRMIGAPEEQVIGHVCHDYICPAEKGKCPITDLGQKVDNSERILLTANREEVPILKTVTTMFLGGKRCLLDSFIDIREKKKLEAQLAQS